MDEPFYAHYLDYTGLDHPGREWLGSMTHAFLIRDPRPMLASLGEKLDEFDLLAAPEALLRALCTALAFAGIPEREAIVTEIRRTLEANRMFDGLHLVTSSVRRFPPDCLDPKIRHNNLIQFILAKIEANVAGADDALMLDMRGFVAETSATHVFIVDRGVPFEECDLTLAQVYRAEEAFCSGTVVAERTKASG